MAMKRRMRALPGGGPHPMAPDHDEDSHQHVCAVAGCVPITTCVSDGEQPCLRRSPDGSLCTVVRGHTGPHAAWSDPDNLPRTKEPDAPAVVIVEHECDERCPAIFHEPPPDSSSYVESELFVAGALSTMPPFDQHYPGYALPFARRALEALSQWEPTDGG